MTHPQQTLWQGKKQTILDRLTPAQRRILSEHTSRLQKIRGELIWPDQDTRVYIVDQGYVRLCQTTHDGRQVVLGVLGPSELFGNFFVRTKTLLHQDPPEDLVKKLVKNSPTDPPKDPMDTGYLEVIRDARLLAIETDVFLDVLKQQPEMLLRLLELAELRRMTLERRLLNLLSKDVAARTAEALLELQKKFGEPCAAHPEGLLHDVVLTHQELADVVGTARQTMTNLLNKLVKAQVIEKHPHAVCVCFPEKLQAIAAQGLNP